MAAALLLCVPGFAVAGAFAPAGDLGLRHDVQLLADYGIIKSPVTSWPMSWDALAADLDAADDLDALPPAIRATAERLR
ncbi:MAG: capsule assembly Wzi family protein, partial [Gammaproteobacteria bacterium]|nr:capsule assembly Wzi family protein [Gammaproteobacteria bacterium]